MGFNIELVIPGDFSRTAGSTGDFAMLTPINQLNKMICPKPKLRPIKIDSFATRKKAVVSQLTIHDQ